MNRFLVYSIAFVAVLVVSLEPRLAFAQPFTCDWAYPCVGAVDTASSGSAAIFGQTTDGTAVYAYDTASGEGIWGQAASGNGVLGVAGTSGTPLVLATAGLSGYGTGTGYYGVYGTSSTSGTSGVVGVSNSATVPDVVAGVAGGISNALGSGVAGINSSTSGGSGVYGSSAGGGGSGVQAVGLGSSVGVWASSGTSYAFYASGSSSAADTAHFLADSGNAALYAGNTSTNDSAKGVFGDLGYVTSGTGSAVYGKTASADGYGVYGLNTGGGYAGYFSGNVLITGSLEFGTSGTSCGPFGDTHSCPSDERLKKNIEPLHGAIDQLLKLKPVTFDWRDPSEHGSQTGKQMGFIAQEVQKSFPEWVKDDGWKAPDGKTYKAIGIPLVQVAALEVESIRTLKTENDGLKADVATLKDQMAVIANGGRPAPAGMARFVNPNYVGWGFGGLMLGLLVANKRKKQAA